MAGFRKWTEEQRNASYRKTVLAIKNGEIPKAAELGCNRCKQKEGIVEYHNNNYDHPTDYLEPLCYTCHMVLHMAHKFPTATNDYWSAIFSGHQYPPVHSRTFPYIIALLKHINEHGSTIKETNYEQR